MNFQVGDMVMHWNHGLGQIMAMEERRVLEEGQLYYAVQMQNIRIWVPLDGMLADRLRPPTPAQAFTQLVAILAGPAGRLPVDRRERKSQLHAKMTDGKATSRCHVIRDLTALEEERSLNEDDRSTLKRARTMLLCEWGHSFKVALAQATGS